MGVPTPIVVQTATTETEKGRLALLEEVVEAMKGEIRYLRDRLEEGEWAQNRLGERIKELEAKLEDGAGGGGGGGGSGAVTSAKFREVDEKIEEGSKKLIEVEKKLRDG